MTQEEAAARIAALEAERDKLLELIRWVSLALPVLRVMCARAGLKIAASKADEMITEVRMLRGVQL